MTGELDETQIRNTDERLKYYRKLEERKTSILNTAKELADRFVKDPMDVVSIGEQVR